MSPYISVALRQKIRNQFRDCCAYCRTAEFLTATTFEFEHIVPTSADGQTIDRNLCLSCSTCNRCKSTRQTATDPQTNEMVPLFHPQNQSWDKHFAWSKSATEIVALTSTGRATCLALKMNRPQLVLIRKMWVRANKHPPD